MWLVFIKELKELLRDRKTLFFMIALPILIFPLIIGGVVYFTDQAVKEAQSEILEYAIVGEKYAPIIAEKLAGQADLKRVELVINGNHRELIATDQVDFIIEIPANYSDDILQSGQSQLKLYLNDSRLNKVTATIEKLVNGLIEAQRATAFTHLNLTSMQQTALLQPIMVEKIDVANQRESVGEKLGGLVPYMIFIL